MSTTLYVMSKEEKGVRIALLGSAFLLFSWFALCELGLAWPISGWFYLGLTVLFSAGLLLPRPVRLQWLRVVVLGLMMALILTLWGVDWTTRKPFLRALSCVREGMTEVEVRRIMGRYMEGTGWPSNPWNGTNLVVNLNGEGGGVRYSSQASPTGQMVIQDALTFRHSKESAFNSDWGIITLSNGRVVRVSFSPD